MMKITSEIRRKLSGKLDFTYQFLCQFSHENLVSIKELLMTPIVLKFTIFLINEIYSWKQFRKNVYIVYLFINR